MRASVIAPMPSLQRVAGIDDAELLHLGDRIVDQLLAHFRIVLPDQLVRGLVVAVEIIVPADRRGIDEALHQAGLLLHHLAARLDQGRVGVEAVIGEQEDLRLELAFLLDRERLRRHIALHRALLVDQERRGIERVGLHLVRREAELGLHPFEVALQPFGGDEQRQLLQVLELLRPGPDARAAPAGPSGTSAATATVGMFCATASKLCSELALMKKSILPASSGMRLFTCGPPGTMVTSRPYFA